MGPCLCGDLYCGSCGNPGLMAAIDGEIDRTEARLGPDYAGRVECSCGKLVLDAAEDDPNGPVTYLHRVCMGCYATDNPEPCETEPDFSEPEEPW